METTVNHGDLNVNPPVRYGFYLRPSFTMSQVRDGTDRRWQRMLAAGTGANDLWPLR